LYTTKYQTHFEVASLVNACFLLDTLLILILGRGGFADVYLGEHVHLGTTAGV
jgi:hypothetical protein